MPIPGLTFRGYQHISWFCASMWGLIAISWGLFWPSENYPVQMATSLAMVTGLFHVAIAVGAIFETVRPVPGKVTSPDCIWFNGIVAIVYGAELYQLGSYH